MDGGVSDDPPDHMEELSMRMHKNVVVSRQRSGSVQSTSSSVSASRGGVASASPSATAMRRSSVASPSMVAMRHTGVASPRLSRRKQPQPQPHPYQQLLKGPGQKPKEKKRSELAKSMSPLKGSPMSITGTDQLSNSYHQIPSRTNANDEPNVLQRSRRQSPHPADVAKGQEAVATELKNKHRLQSIDAMQNANPDKKSERDPMHSQNSTNVPSDDSGEIPTFAIGNSLESSESAEELQQLIEAMQTEFQRLRFSKLQAEAKAEKLQTDLTNQQQEMERQFESLSTDNERLKTDATESKIKLGRVVGKAKKLEAENDKLRMAKEVAEAKAVAAELRASAAEEEAMAVQNSMKALMEMALHNGERRKDESSRMRSPLFRRSKESAFSKPEGP